jgi:hypothetical protein
MELRSPLLMGLFALAYVVVGASFILLRRRSRL